MASPPRRARSRGARRAAGRGGFPRLTDRLTLGRSPLRVSPYCLGRLPPGRPELVAHAFDAGINFFFVSTDLHWVLYDSLREGLRRLLRDRPAVREQIVVVATSYVEEKFARAARRELLWTMPELGHLDVLCAGALRGPDAMPRLSMLDEALEQQDCGARAVGASFHDRRAAVTAHRHELVDVAFVRYNARHPGARQDLFPRLHDRSGTLLFNFTSMLGRVDDDEWRALSLPRRFERPKATDHYRFALSAPHMDGILGSVADPGELGQLAATLAEGPLDDDAQRYLINLGKLASGEATFGGDADS